MTLVGANTLALAFADLAAAAAAPTIRARLTPKGSPARIRSALPSITDLRACAQHVRFVQTEKNSVRGYVFRFAPESGHRATQSPCPFGANTTGLVRRSKSDLGQPVKWVRRIGLRAILPRAPSPPVTTSEGGDLGSQTGEEPNARSQALFDRRENARWSGSQEPLRSRTGAQSMQTGDRPCA